MAPSHPIAISSSVDVSRLVLSTLRSISDNHAVPLGSPYPDPRLFPFDKLNRYAYVAGRRKERLDLKDALPPGHPDLVRQIGSRLGPARQQPPLSWVTASTGRETRLILLDDVAYFRADNKYTTVVTAEGEALLRTPIRELLEVLDPTVFKQIHRGTVINMKAIAGVTRDETGKGIVRLRERPETLSVSAPFMTLFRNM